MKKIFGNKVFVLILTLTVIVGVVAGVIAGTKSKSGFISNVAMVTITPIQKVFYRMDESIKGFFGYFKNVDKIETENQKLRTAIKNLEIDKQRSEHTEIENSELRDMLTLAEAYPQMELTAAEVVSRNTSNWYEGFVIDKGSADGLKIGQGVISADKALVGRISDIGSTWARVTALTDSGHSAGVRIIRSGELGVIEGDLELAKDGNCKLSFISKNNDIVVGDYLETSGLGGIYPKGIEIGKVVDIKSDIQGISQYAVIEVTVDLRKISKVMVVRNASYASEE